MYVVAITRWERPLQDELAALAPLLGLALYDAKMRLAGPLPVIFARVHDADQARALLRGLRERGHGAVACDLDKVTSSSDMSTPRTYAFEAGAFSATHSAWGTRTVPFAEIAGLIRANAIVVEQSTETEKTKKFSMGRAVLTSGLSMRKSKVTTSSSSVEEREQVLYIVRRSGRDAMLLRANSLRHAGLGDRVQPTSLANFNTLVEMLRERATEALFDDRLMSQRRKTSLAVSGTAASRVTESSNASANDLAAHLIVMAHLGGQH